MSSKLLRYNHPKLKTINLLIKNCNFTVSYSLYLVILQFVTVSMNILTWHFSPLKSTTCYYTVQQNNNRFTMLVWYMDLHNCSRMCHAYIKTIKNHNFYLICTIFESIWAILEPICIILEHTFIIFVSFHLLYRIVCIVYMTFSLSF